MQDSIKTASKVIASGVCSGLVRFVLMSAVGVGMLSFGASYFSPAPYDNTDPVGGRSGLGVLTDALTGCEYLSTPGGGLTPRLSTDGSQICTPL